MTWSGITPPVIATHELTASKISQRTMHCSSRPVGFWHFWMTSSIEQLQWRRLFFLGPKQGLRAAARGDYPGGVGAKEQTTKITATMTSRQQNSGRPLAPGRMSIGRHLGLLKKLVVLRVSSGWLPE